ncbi:hypothetical protein QN277_004523 [Acacia crassicarpa]|uniref:ATP-dependent Clp protease proteolytic subunit n=1 Tax=Acacia crassicarpa TaxID=499986 RepID=A0AAE1J3V3_9FABA|nr:hypothetical protein QN277_004523 [Acacia crassicarpa]
MDLLSISPSHPSTLLTSRQLHLSPSKPSISTFNSQISIPLRPHSSRTSLRCMLSSSPKSPKTLDFVSQPENFYDTFKPSCTQTPATAMKGAESDVMGLLLRERIVFLGSDIDDVVADAIIGQLLLLDAQDPNKDIRLFINSTGGSLSATMAIFDVVRLVRAPISTVALGISASTASIILGGGTKGKRLAMPNTRIMIHQPVGGASGQASDVEVQAREALVGKDNVTRIISEFTGRSYEQVEKDIEKDRYMSPIEAVEYGIIDGVIDRDSIIPLMPIPERVVSSLYEEITKDPQKFANPEIPDDEIY